MSSETPPPHPESSPTSTSKSQGMDENTWCMIAHLLGFCGYLGNGIGSIIGPLVLWLIKKETAPLVAEHAKEALNFNISITIYFLACGAFMLVTFGIGAIIAVPAMIALLICHLIFTIIAAIKASEGVFYRYPLTLRLVK